jgi:transcriptional regulator with XRE-family HTH domain
MDQRAIPDTDETVGANLRRFRSLRGLTQGELGEQIGVTYQQVYKYEKGENPISAAKLLACACILEVPVEQFYAGLDDIGTDVDPHLLALIQRTAGELISIPEPVRSQMVEIIRSVRRAAAHLVAVSCDQGPGAP